MISQSHSSVISETTPALSLSSATVAGRVESAAAVIGVAWPIPGELDDVALNPRLFAPAGCNPLRSEPPPDGPQCLQS